MDNTQQGISKLLKTKIVNNGNNYFVEFSPSKQTYTESIKSHNFDSQDKAKDFIKIIQYHLAKLFPEIDMNENWETVSPKLKGLINSNIQNLVKEFEENTGNKILHLIPTFPIEK